MEKTYTNEDITVVWKPDVCIHSALCWHGLLEVFDPRKRPWVDMEGADTQAIMAQVDKCPSGALSWHRNAEGSVKAADVDVETVVEAIPNGPLMIYGNIKVKDAEGNETDKFRVTAFCRCGGSANKPYCDGTHKKIDFKG